MEQQYANLYCLGAISTRGGHLQVPIAQTVDS